MSRGRWARRASALLAFAIAVGLSADQYDLVSDLGGELSEALQIPDDLARVPKLQEKIEYSIEKVRNRKDAHDELTRLAYLYHANGYSDRAKDLYHWLILNSRDAEERGRLNYIVANLVMEKGDSTAALHYLEESVESYPRYSRAYLALGDAQFKSGDLEAAEANYRSSLRLEKELASARIGLARIHERRGELEKMVAELESLLKIHPTNSSARALLSQVYARLGEARRAYNMSESIVYSSSAPPADPWLQPVQDALYSFQRLDFLFLDYFMVDELEAALPFLERMESLEPRNPRCDRYRGLWYMKSGAFYRAADSFRKGLEKGGEVETFYPLLTKALSFQGKKSAAETTARGALDQFGANSKICLELARLLIERKEFVQADAVLEQGLESDPYNIELLLTRARVGGRIGDFEMTRESLGLVYQLSPMDSKILVRAGLVFMESGQFKEALPYFLQANMASPFYQDAIELLADAYFELGTLSAASDNVDEALEYFDRSIDIRGDNAEALSARARLAIENGKFIKAETAMRELLDVTGNQPAMLFVYGDVLYRNDKHAQARGIWERSLAEIGDELKFTELRRRLLARLESF